ncbi:MAG: response regulator [Candidatus Cloacimonetes bacterium]|jgi:CheY-like chemotaxis protein|nr:response regulator [Candidatus Cloacimonadota bacterium]MDY0337112.1 response regulator [Candidatus Cloacimonadaceae bacterium]MCB5269474.1 response regulator [Candidatus Cloacimonadota bacterium]MCK9335118.1 response regulator [Candidatus Cloacimonadota bacterium]MDD2543689.1 response regulator [Candidatus Cloacimonadota bacterium]
MNQRKILVVDDEQNIRDIIGEFLGELGYQVSVAVDGLDALEKIQDERYDLYIIDVYMPRMGGLELISRLKEMQPLAVIIVTTGFSSIDVAIRAIRTGAFHYLTKPIQPEELIKVVESGLGHAQELYESGSEEQGIPVIPGVKSSELLLLRGFNEEQSRDFMDIGVLISYSKGSPIPLGDDLGSMILVEDGSVNAYYNGSLVETLKEHDVWGEETFINPGSVFTGLSAQTDAQIRHFKRRKIMEFFTYNDETLTKRYMINLIQCIYMKWRRSCFRIGLYSGFNMDNPTGK